MDYRDWAEKVNAHFTASEANWLSIKRDLEIGHRVEGRVVARAPFDAWLDIGVGFPALLEIIEIRDLEPDDYQAGKWCEEGTLVAASCRQI